MTRKRKLEERTLNATSNTNREPQIRQRKTSESTNKEVNLLSKKYINNNNTKNLALRTDDPPIRKSHRISKLRKANKSDITNSTFSPPDASSSNLSTSVTSSITNPQQSQTQNLLQTCSNTAQSSFQIPPKPIRKILVWSENDTRWFFEALCEFGKDFHHIQAYIASKYEKKGIASDLIKNYENVRQYYYRMWHKVYQMLKLPYEIERVVLETYGLINYGELWKRVGSKLDVKLIGNLQQLVLYGFTAFKVKGKMYRVRTPVCNALKRIHNIQIPKPPTYQIPKEITIEIVPETNKDWIHVQKLSLNPRLRTKLTMQHRLSTLIEHLEKRWSKENVLENAMKHLFNDQNEELPEIEPNFFIRLKPKNAEKICTDVYLKSTGNTFGNLRSLQSQNSNLDLSLSSFLNKQKRNNENEDKNFDRSNKNINKDKDKEDDKKEKSKEDNKEETDKEYDNKKDESIEELNNEKSKEEDKKKEKEENHIQRSEMPSIRMFQMLDELNEKCNEESAEDEDVIIEEGRLFDLEPNDLFEAVSLLDPPENMTLFQWLDRTGDPEEKEEDEKEDEKEEEPATVALKSPPDSSKISSRKKATFNNAPDVELCNLDMAKRGWLKTEADSLSIGELFLLVGCPDKIQLEYSWIESKVTNDNSSFISDEEKDEDDVEIFDKLAFCANALLASFKKPILNQNLDGKISTSVRQKTKNSKETKRKETKKSTPKQNEPEKDSSDNKKKPEVQFVKPKTIIEVLDESKKKSTKNLRKTQESSSIPVSVGKGQSERLSSSGVRVQAVSKEKVEEALADLYSNSQNMFARNKSSMLKSPPVKPITPKKDKSVEFVVSLGPSFVQNLGQGTFQIQNNDVPSACKSPIIPVKFIPTQSITSQSKIQTEQSNQVSFLPFSRHHIVHTSSNISSHQQSVDHQFVQQISTNEFISNFPQQAPFTSSNVKQPQPPSISSSSSSAWLSELHNESSMGSLLAACDLMSQEMMFNKPRDVALTDNSVDLISQFADFATQHNIQNRTTNTNKK